MNAIDRETVEIFTRSARGVLGQPDVDVAAALEELGWRDFLAADPSSVVPSMFELMGELLIAGSALDDVAFDALGSVGEELRGTGHVFGHPRGSEPAAVYSGAGFTVDAVVLGGRRDVPVALVATLPTGTAAVSLDPSSIDFVETAGLDPSLGVVRVRGTVAGTNVVRLEGAPAAAVGQACRRALAHELLGVTAAMLAMANDYAKVRTQFGQPIGAFQAVKHRLADVYVAQQAATSVVGESWRSEPECTTVAAKALAAHACALAAENCLQVLGAIGFTLEHDLHRFVRRGRVLDRLHGSEAQLRQELGQLLRAGGHVPRPGSA
jgi:hypothetical protein